MGSSFIDKGGGTGRVTPSSARSTSRDGRDDAHLVLRGDDRRQVVEVADVFVVDVDVDEAPQLVPLEDALAERGELGAEVRKDLADGRPVGVDDVSVAG